MNLRLLPHAQSLFPRRALLLRGSHPAQWAVAMKRLGIAPEKVQAFAVPDTIPNQLYGCVVLLPPGALPLDTGDSTVLCLAEEKLLLPERATYRPLLERPALEKMQPSGFILLHPHVGIVLLETPIEWSQLFVLPEISPTVPRCPSEGVTIPKTLRALRREVSPEALLAELETPAQNAGEEKLPFDLKKLMAGNTREMEKYLKYLEAHPDKALNLGIPLDLTGSSRGPNTGRFKFGGSNSTRPKPSGWIWLVFFIASIFFRAISDRSGTTLQTPSIDTQATPAQERYRAKYQHWLTHRSEHDNRLAEADSFRSPEKHTAEMEADLQKLKDSVVAFYELRVFEETPALLAAKRKASGADGLGDAILLGAQIQDSLRKVYGIDASGKLRLQPNWQPPTSPPPPPVSRELPFSLRLLGLAGLLAALVLGTAAGLSYLKLRRTGDSAFGLQESTLSRNQKMLFVALLFVLLWYVLHPALCILGLGIPLIFVCFLLVVLVYRLFGKSLQSNSR